MEVTLSGQPNTENGKSAEENQVSRTSSSTQHSQGRLQNENIEVAQLIEQCFTSPPTQYRLYGRRFLQVKRPNQQYQSTEGDATKYKENNENN